MDKKKIKLSNTGTMQKKPTIRSNTSNTSMTPNNNTPKNVNHRSISNLSTLKDSDAVRRLKSTNVTLERNGSMPNLSATGNRLQLDKTTKLRFAYDKYLSSLEAKYVFQQIEKNISSNVNEQKKVFRDEFVILKDQIVTLSNELEKINGLKTEKKLIDQKIEALEMINKALVFNDSDEEIMTLFSSTASKVVLKNFKQLDETDLNAVKILLNEIIEPLKLLDYENKINVRIQLKDSLIKVAMLTKELDTLKLKCEKLFDEQDSLLNYNKSLKILKAQFGENPDPNLLPSKSNLVEEVENMLDEMEW
ncbi:uncharacterized protein LOC100168128 [Acyrthosiphon pisum]|uniref:Uncharacterized protein n=1 Tax=Acyrthosiphon pisum TaxID=7029 RepID=A0A8R2A4M5_ACYPI|nr:uncharacterized protein LOC100168128 [Acyrthosiphon pisum]|eukprot:XP_001948663.1 PREDICTED: uncharacterized protein LOC100168128 [Acyrthosiphon pisum]